MEGDAARCGGEEVPELDVAALFSVMRELFDRTELGRAGAKCGEGDSWRSGVPFAWKNFGWDLSSPIFDPTAEPLELCGAGGIDSPLA